METEFTPWASLLGGVLIGVSTVLLMALHGRIMGATGILSGALFASGLREKAWRIALILGMVTGPVVILALTGSFPAVDVPVSLTLLIVGGVIVGLGASLGSGCTSGHGICGMARLSPRSIAATATFMLATGVTVYILRHVLGG